jgi:hypothetical protein
MVKEVQKGKYEQMLRALMDTSEDDLKDLYNAREIEPEQADEDRNLCALHGLRKHVAPEAVGAKSVLGHEFAHSLQGVTGGFVDNVNNFCGWFWVYASPSTLDRKQVCVDLV